jgi:hypothetical protein
MEREDFPGLYQAADLSSDRSQQSYILIIAIDLVSMVIASILSIYNYSQIEAKSFIYCIAGLLLSLSLILTIIIKSKKYEDVWYQSRALAESCKTLTWRFITGSESFECDKTEEIVRQLFLNRLKELSLKFLELNKVLNAEVISLPIITEKMMAVRRMNLQERKKYYLEHRIKEQEKWYSNKAEINKKKYNTWFWIIVLSQALGILSVFFLIKYPSSDWNFIGLFTTISSAAISWLQLKQHQELKQAYTTAAQELCFIEAKFDQLSTEKELSEFILDAENAISREHTLWLAQKRK